MVAPARELQSDYQEQDRLKSILPKSSNELFVLPLVKVRGQLSIPAEVMVTIWEQIVREGKRELLFYDGLVKDLKGWIDYIYNPANHVALVVDKFGHIYHIAWINKFVDKHGFLHHCSLGKYNRRSWPLLKKFWGDMKDQNGEPLIFTLLGVTPETNELAVRLVRMLGWTILGTAPRICHIANENRFVGGVISYCSLNGG